MLSTEYALTAFRQAALPKMEEMGCNFLAFTSQRMVSDTHMGTAFLFRASEMKYGPALLQVTVAELPEAVVMEPPSLIVHCMLVPGSRL